MSAEGTINVPTDEQVRSRYVHYLASEPDENARRIEFDAWLKGHDNTVRHFARIDFETEHRKDVEKANNLTEAVEEAVHILSRPLDTTVVLDSPAGRALWKATLTHEALEYLENVLREESDE